jgi:hypothetical protein
LIYFIQNLQTTAIKVGFSEDPESRLAALRTANCDPLVLLGTIPGDPSLEFKLHAQFSSWRIHGEWFRGELPLLIRIHRLIEQHRISSVPRLMDQSGPRREGEGSRGPIPRKLRQATIWIRARLEAGEQRLQTLRTCASLEGFTSTTLYEAMKRLGVERFDRDGSMWVRLPSSEEQTG